MVENFRVDKKGMGKNWLISVQNSKELFDYHVTCCTSTNSTSNSAQAGYFFGQAKKVQILQNCAKVAKFEKSATINMGDT